MSKYTIVFLSIVLVVLSFCRSWPANTSSTWSSWFCSMLICPQRGTSWGDTRASIRWDTSVLGQSARNVSTFLFIQWRITPWLGMWVGGAVSALVGWFIGYVLFPVRTQRPLLCAGDDCAGRSVRLSDVEPGVHLAGAKGLEVTWLGHRPDLMEFGGKTRLYYIILVMAILGVMSRRDVSTAPAINGLPCV